MAVVKDKATAFKNEISGAQTNKIICKASSHEVAGPKKKHVDYLLQLTNDPKCQFTILADLIADRLKHSSWVVVFKTLILSHNLMTIGNDKFLQCVATRRHMFEMDNFSDKSDILATDMSSYLRKYARYVRHIGIGYKALAVDIGRAPKGEDSPFRTMDSTKLLKSTAVVQDQLDLLLEVEFVSSELSNGVINTAFLMLYKDLIKLYSVYNDAMINLLEKFFEMKRSDCKEVIGFYRRFLLRQETVQRFLQLAEGVGVDKDSHLNLRQVPENFLPALEQHLSEMESTKKSGSQPSPQIQKASAKLQELREKEIQKNKPPSQSGSGIVSGYPSADEEVLEAQRKRFEELKRRAKEKSTGSGSSSANSSSVAKPTAAASTAAATSVLLSPPQQTSTSSSGAGDLLGLDTSSSSGGQQGVQTSFDPWGSSTPSTSIPAAQQATPSTSNPFSSPNSSTFSSPPTSTPNVSTSDPWGTQAPVQSSYQEVDLFKELQGGPNFDSVFGQSSSPQNSFPAPSSAAPLTASSSSSGGPMPAAMGDILTPQAVGIQAEIAAQEKKTNQKPLGLTNDVESSLARAAANLNMDTSTGTRSAFNKKTSHQWTAPKESVKTGGPNFQKQNLQAKTISSMESKNAANWNSGMQSSHFPLQPQQQQQQPMMGGPQMMGGPTMGTGAPMMMGTGMMPQYGGMGQPMMGQPMMGQPFMQRPSMGMQQPPMGMQQGSMGAWPQQQQQNTNPFGQQQNPSLL